MSFDQRKYIADWQKENMKNVSVKFNIDYIEQFKSACKILKVSQREVFKNAIDETIAKAKKLK